MRSLLIFLFIAASGIDGFAGHQSTNQKECQKNYSTSKDFNPIDEAYTFFLKHSNESRLGILAMRTKAVEIFKKNTKSRVLDFGSGDGKVISKLFSGKDFVGNRLFVDLVEPAKIPMNRSEKLLANFPAKNIGRYSHLDKIDSEVRYDLILVNHVAYYVSSLSKTIESLYSRLTDGGSIVLIMGNSQNDLVRMSSRIFEKSKIDKKFHDISDLISILDRGGYFYSVEHLNGYLRFTANKNSVDHINRFVLGNEYVSLKNEGLKYIQNFERNGVIEMKISDSLITIRKDPILSSVDKTI
ncbi:MAG: methyltransferase domain-containing protein [Bdellovibrionales bacterium]